MSKQEFLDELRRMLNRELEAAEVADHIRYYSEYIENAMRQGKTEEQVISELGDPRMIARTILDVDQQRGEQTGYSRQEESTVYTESEDGTYHEEEAYGNTGGFHTRHFSVQTSGFKVWLVIILILVVLIAILGTVFTILWKLLPFLLIAAAAVWIYRFLTGNR